MREVTRFVLFVNVAPMKSHELRKFHEIFVYSIGATFSNKTNLVTSGTPLFTIFEIAKIQSNLGLQISYIELLFPKNFLENIELQFIETKILSG